MTDVTIISGFLGAGKTTLIKKLLSEVFQGQKVVLLENEYGEVGIDGGFMKDSGIQITELNSGCICCTLAGDFQDAINEIVDKFAPDRLIIEPSGVGKLSDIRRAVETVAKGGRICLGGSATVVDANKCKMYLKNFGEFFIDQVKCAETVIFSRSQLVSEDKLKTAFDMIRELNPDARIITTPWSEISGQIIFDAIEHPSSLIDVNSVVPPHEHHHDDDDEDEEEGHEHHHHHDDDDEHEEHEHHHHHDDDDDGDEDEHEHHHHHDDEDDDEHEEHHHHHEHGHHHHHHHHHHDGEHDADEIFDDIGLETASKLDVEVLKAAFEALEDEEKYGTVLRMKGIMPTTDGRWIHFDYTPGESEIREGGADYTGRLCVIGVGLKRENILELLKI
ncbi:MAG: GTP-binding protein [Clostridiales bacterium]|nr:GTP-binding protein [Clostridiales bacterium]